MSQVTLIDSMGSDLTVVNAARVSFDKRHEEYDISTDDGLLRYMAAHGHMSPFRHVQVQLHIRCPEFIARQLYKHVVGVQAIKDHAWNEVSGRYVTFERSDLWEPAPGGWRTQSANTKQGSDGPLDEYQSVLASEIYTRAMDNAYASYRALLSTGVSREQARAVLPLSMYTQFYWTASLEAMFHFCQLRKASNAQGEIQDLAAQIEQCVSRMAPRSWFYLEQAASASRSD